ncbi:MBOAT family protein, partial [Aliarcobacter cryaerophilus]
EVYENILGKDKTTLFIIIGFILIIFFKNSMEKMINFKPSYFNLIYMITILLVGISMMSNVSEFLYFNF